MLDKILFVLGSINIAIGLLGVMFSATKPNPHSMLLTGISMVVVAIGYRVVMEKK